MVETHAERFPFYCFFSSEKQESRSILESKEWEEVLWFEERG